MRLCVASASEAMSEAREGNDGKLGNTSVRLTCLKVMSRLMKDGDEDL
jgi:hypothetical protein